MPLTTASGHPRPYCALCVRDVAEVIGQLARALPASPLFCVGWSMGGNLLIQHLGEAGDECKLRGAIAVSPAVDLKAIHQNWNGSAVGKVYGRIIGLGMLRNILHHRRALIGAPMAGRAGRPFTTWDALYAALWGTFEGNVYAPLWGLTGGAEAYFEACSCVRAFDGVRRKLLVVHAEDDPIVPLHSMPLSRMAANPHVVCALTRHGGHLGYTAGGSPLQHTWTDRILLHFLRHMLTGDEPRPPPAVAMRSALECCQGPGSNTHAER